MKYFVMLLCGLLELASGKPTPKEPYMAVVRQVMGGVHAFGRDTTVSTGVNVGDLPASGQTFETLENGQLVLRFHPDFMRIEARSKTRFSLSYSSTDSSRTRSVRMEKGQMVLGVTKNSPPLQSEDANCWARSKEARFAQNVDGAVSTVIVLDGVVEVHSRSKDVTEFVHRGQKAIADLTGLKISNAEDNELAQVGLGQNILEVDFWNPSTEEFSTLEVEYENNF